MVVESIGSVEIEFRCKDPPTDPPELGWISQKPLPTRHGSQIDRFPDRVSQKFRWVGYTVELGQAYA